ncbi:MAG TPA: hypothetical protein EYQ63_00400 [Fuerstia sp.]|nr:hypothetical protein [Fuerstiella sp.]
MIEHGLLRRRHLPHLDVEAKPFFVTGCLHGSIPAAGLSKIRHYRAQLDERPRPDSMNLQQWEIHKHKLAFKMVDDLLDGRCPSEHLSDPTLARIVCDAVLHFAGMRYLLLAFVVMPSHHHWLFLPREDWVDEFTATQANHVSRRTPREAISHSIQSFTATQCNRALQRTGPFWQTETYDHFARDEQEVLRIIQYIEHNPVNAGFVDQPSDWRWSSASIRQRLGIAPGSPVPRTETMMG